MKVSLGVGTNLVCGHFNSTVLKPFCFAFKYAMASEELCCFRRNLCLCRFSYSLGKFVSSY